MQNGALGEARAKAFLMDRFWILERSVDIEGADLIIQRRLTSQNLLDRTPPKLGFVQVKFFQSDKTTQFIPVAYITDSEGKAREDFFLLLHTGYEEGNKTFFLTTDMVIADFEIVIDSGVDKYKLSGTKILNSEKYLVKSNSATLDRIENRLELADFKKNREFISWKLPNIVANPSAILPDYKEKIDNSWGDIPTEFQRIKENAIQGMKDIEKIYLELKGIAEEFDPLEAFNKIENLYHYYGRDNSYGNWGRKLMEGLYDDNFYYTCKNHIEKVENLRKDGLLDEYMNMRKLLTREVISFLTQHFPISSNTVHTMVIKFSIPDFKIVSVEQSLIDAPTYFNVPEDLDQFGHVPVAHGDYHGIKSISASSFEFYWLAGRISIDETYKNDLPKFYEKIAYTFYRECLEKIYDLKYND